MPTYELYNQKTDEYFEEFMSISQKEQYLKDNPDIKQIPSAPNFISRSGERTNLGGHGGFNEVLHKVADGHPQSDLARQVKTRTAADVRRDKVIKKHNLKDIT
jgi:hypothetical protein